MLLAALAFAAVVLTLAMFMSKNAMLGFPSAVFWALLGGYCYGISEATWDIYFITAFACLLGMTTFCAFGAYGLREKRDSIGDMSMERGDGKYIDEQKEEPDEPAEKNWYEDDGIPDVRSQNSPRNRAAARRAGTREKGEFDF